MLSTYEKDRDLKYLRAASSFDSDVLRWKIVVSCKHIPVLQASDFSGTEQESNPLHGIGWRIALSRAGLSIEGSKVEMKSISIVLTEKTSARGTNRTTRSTLKFQTEDRIHDT